MPKGKRGGRYLLSAGMGCLSRVHVPDRSLSLSPTRPLSCLRRTWSEKTADLQLALAVRLPGEKLRQAPIGSWILELVVAEPAKKSQLCTVLCPVLCSYGISTIPPDVCPVGERSFLLRILFEDASCYRAEQRVM
jgi:hypothetical protein